MGTVASRTVASSPQRTSTATWDVIVDLLTQNNNDTAKTILNAVSGIGASIIAERAPKDAPIVVTCDGPRTRLYCSYDESSIDGSETNEQSLGFDPLNGDWAVSLPCPEADLDWIQKALAEHGTRITARKLDDSLEKNSEDASGTSQPMSINTESFLKS